MPFHRPPLEDYGGLAPTLNVAASCHATYLAAAPVLPDKRLSSVKPSSVIKRMKEKAFARNVSRQSILECEKLGIGLEKFVELSLRAMQGIAEELGL